MDTYGALLSGGTLFSITPAMREDHRAMHEALRKSGVTVWVSTPSFVRLCAFDEAFNAKSLPALRKVIVCGEILPAALAAEMMDRFPNTEIWNSYGPTETTVVMTSILITREVIARGEPLPVGWPMPGARVLIRDTEDRDLPEGEQGEIIIAGACVSPGYIGRPELRAQAFFKIDGEQAYRSGDLGRMIGGLVFCDGRKDDQVKVRGFRIELAEVTGALRSHPGVRDAAVIAHEDGTGERELVAYVVGNATSRQMRTHLASQLPDYMVPAHFVTLPALPLTRNGKVDRKQLPDPSADRLTSSLEVIPPVDSVQMRLVEMWERILEVTPVGIDDDFYELGGHSLRAAEFMVQVEKTFGRHVPLSELFKAPTIEQFARVLAATPPDANWPIIEQIRASGSRPPFFCVPGFLDLTRHLSAEQPCYGVHLAVMETMPDPTTGVRDMARKCVEEIRVLQPEGPYAIGGHSFGAVVAYEIAQQLRALGQPVAQLVLIDPDPPRPLATGTLGYHVNRYAFHVRQLLQLSGEDRWAYLRQRFRIGSARLSNSLEKRLARYAPAEGEVFEEAARHYYPQPYDSPVTMLLARDTHLRTRLANDPRMAWCELVSGGIEIQDLPGDHYTLVREPNVSRLAKRLTVALYGAVEKPAAGSFR
jgi:thioesterase domain-containing protein/acyl carrier protein